MGLRGLSRLKCVCVFQSDLSTPIRVSLIVVPDNTVRVQYRIPYVLLHMLSFWLCVCIPVPPIDMKAIGRR